MLDVIERVALAVLFSFLALALVRSWWDTGSLASLILLVSEGSVIVFVLIRRFTNEVSKRPADWFLALVGTTAPLLVQPTGGQALAPTLICLLLMLLGMAVQIAAKFTLRRSFGVVAANRGVKVGGPYRLIRHPMYAGYFMTQIGFLLLNPSMWNATIYAVAFGFQLGRILAEERVLSRDASYREFAAVVKYRLVPRVF